MLGKFTVFRCGTREMCEEQAVLWSAQLPAVAKIAIAMQCGKEVVVRVHE
jgi:hypothetical protein